MGDAAGLLDVTGIFYWRNGSTEAITNGNIQCAGSWNIYSDATFNPTGGTVTLDGTGAQTIYNVDTVDNDSSFWNLTLLGSGIRTVSYSSSSTTKLYISNQLIIGSSGYTTVTFDRSGTGTGEDTWIHVNGSTTNYGTITINNANDNFDFDDYFYNYGTINVRAGTFDVGFDGGYYFYNYGGIVNLSGGTWNHNWVVRNEDSFAGSQINVSGTGTLDTLYIQNYDGTITQTGGNIYLAR